MTEPADQLQALSEAGRIGALERALAGLLARLEPGIDPVVPLGAVFASAALREGHACLDLDEVVAEPPLDEEGEPLPDWSWPEVEDWIEALSVSEVVGDGTADEPLVLRGRLLYLARYAQREGQLVASLKALCARSVPAVDVPRRDALLSRLFAGRFHNEGQIAAVGAALSQRLVVLAGGPGTGKTTTVVRLLAALADQARARGEADPSVRLLAPTGKAAARLAESIRDQKKALIDPTGDFRIEADLLAAVPDEATTIHRALGPRNDWLTAFAHGPARPWTEDVVLIDEVSMVDLSLLDHVLGACRPDARVVLVGDPDQLASVGVGSVLRDLCGVEGAGVVRLTESRRFAEGGPVGQLATAVLGAAADPEAAVARVHAVLRSVPGAQRIGVGVRADHDVGLLDRILAGWRPFLSAHGEARLGALEHFRVLCATRVGAAGVEALNRAVVARLRAQGRVRGGAWFDGQPILVRSNDYGVKLFNGDTGVIVRRRDGSLRAVFERPGGEVLAIPPSRLPRHETAFAITVHQSQGSEFAHVLVVLPERDHPLLNRELLYTAITRAKETVAVRGSPEVIAAAVRRRTRRVSGLAQRW